MLLPVALMSCCCLLQQCCDFCQLMIAAVSMPQHAAAPTDLHSALTIIASASLALSLKLATKAHASCPETVNPSCMFAFSEPPSAQVCVTHVVSYFECRQCAHISQAMSSNAPAGWWRMLLEGQQLPSLPVPAAASLTWNRCRPGASKCSRIVVSAAAASIST
jgi:hypothetical protein